MLAAEADAVPEVGGARQDGFLASFAFAVFRSSHSFSVATITQPFPLHAF
jgi:hypothetical protein